MRYEIKQPCSCGTRERHMLCRRKTIDEVTLIIWSNGGISRGSHIIEHWRIPVHYPNSTTRDPRWIELFQRVVELYDIEEVPTLVEAVKKLRLASWAGHRYSNLSLAVAVLFDDLQEGIGSSKD
jgi:hypothetical protein